MKKGITANQEWKNEHFNVITDNEALAIEIELKSGEKVILATIYCPNGNPSLRLFGMINALSKQVIFLGDFNSKLKQFGCVKQNKSRQTLVNTANDLEMFYLNQFSPNKHTREDPGDGISDILEFRSALLMITWEVITSLSKLHLTSHSNEIHHLQNHATDLTKPTMTYFINTLKDSLNSIDTDVATQDELEELAVTLCDKLLRKSTHPHLKRTAATTPNHLLVKPS